MRSPWPQPLLVTSNPASTQILQTNVWFTLQQQPMAHPTSSKHCLEGKRPSWCFRTVTSALALANWLQKDEYTLKEPDKTLQTLHSCYVTFPLPLSHAVISGQHYLRKSRALQKHTQSLLSSPPTKQTQAEIPKSPCPRQIHSIFFSEEVRKGEYKGLKERGSPVWVTSVIISSNYWWDTIFHLTAYWLDKK